MIIALLFVIVFVTGIVLLPIGWFNQSHDVKTASILWFLALAILYVFDAEVIVDIFVSAFQFYTSFPWVGVP